MCLLDKETVQTIWKPRTRQNISEIISNQPTISHSAASPPCPWLRRSRPRSGAAMLTSWWLSDLFWCRVFRLFPEPLSEVFWVRAMEWVVIVCQGRCAMWVSRGTGRGEERWSGVGFPGLCRNYRFGARLSYTLLASKIKHQHLSEFCRISQN